MSAAALQAIRKLSAVGIALSSEKDERRLMELILLAAMDLTRADAGTLYSHDELEGLAFEILITESLGIHRGGSSSDPVAMPRIPLQDEAGRPNISMIATCAAISGHTIRVDDAYADDGFDFSGTRALDEQMGYRSQSFLAVPMRDHQNEVIGVLQLINARKGSPLEVAPFDDFDQLLVESLASQAAIAVTKKRLLDGQRELFESFIEVLAAAVDAKSPHTGNHCRRVPELTLMIADAAAACEEGPLSRFTMSEEERYELQIAGWLHDCGKVTTPEHVVDKATKLETLFDRVELVYTRIEVLKRDIEIRALRTDGALDEGAVAEIARLDEDARFLRRVNVGGETMSEEDQERVREIAARRWIGPDGTPQPLLTEDEVYNLLVKRGTLTPEERTIINDHIVTTIEMLEALPFPRHLARVPEIAGGHHERMDGRGYPRGLTGDQMPVQARAMAIADIFEALTARDRPYKHPMPLSQALGILARMSETGHIDPDLFDVFVAEKVYLRYAETFLEPDQIDDVDADEIRGHARAKAS